MKKEYIYPQTTVFALTAELMIATSDKLERGAGSGGNTAETKDDGLNGSSDDEWDIWQ